MLLQNLGRFQRSPTVRQYLADAQIVQTAHPYFLPDRTRRWPFYYINGFVHRDSGTLSLQGNFRAGTELTFAFDSVHMVSTFSAAADGKTLASMRLDELCRSYQAFTQETGTLVMVQEFGFNNSSRIMYRPWQIMF